MKSLGLCDTKEGPTHDHIFNQNLENRFVSAARA